MTDTPTNISTSPNFKIVQPQFGDNSHLLTDKVFLSATSGMADRAYARCFETEEERETIEKARKYNIPFNKDSLDLKEFISSCEFDDLMAEVEDYEDSIRKAKEFYVYWDFCKYDPEGLEDAIEREINIQDESGYEMSAYDEHRGDQIRELAYG
jgi:hypothetical protein